MFLVLSKICWFCVRKLHFYRKEQLGSTVQLNMAFSLLCDEPAWLKKEVQWYMLRHNAPRENFRNDAQAGCIFKIDYRETSLDSKDKVIFLQSCTKGKIRVRWAPKLFYGLDAETKDILLAVEDYAERLRIYEDKQELLVYAKQLKLGDDVCVQFPKQRHFQGSGTIKYIGPVHSKSPATFFGIELRTKCGDTDGKAKDGEYRFRCQQGRGAYVTVNKLIPPSSVDEKKKNVRKTKTITLVTCSKPSQTDDMGVKNALQPSFFKVGDRVLAKVKLKKNPSKEKLVLSSVVHVYKENIAVEVDEHEGSVLKPWDGWYDHIKLCETSSQHTVLVPLQNVSSLNSPSTSPATQINTVKKRKTVEIRSWKNVLCPSSRLAFGTVAQPPFPLDQWELGQISIGGEKLLKSLAHDLQIKEADEIFRKKMGDFETTCQLLRQWWEQLQEGHKAAFEEVKYSLKKNEFGELVYFMEGGKPTDGEFHASIEEIVVFTFGKRLQLLADKLKVTLTADQLPQSVLGKHIFSIWQKRHPGTEKLSQLVHAIKEISKEILKTGQTEQMSIREAEELEDLAHELEQGLSERVIRSISSTVQKDVWYEFGYALGLSQLRLNAMERKLPLSNRVFHVLRYWQIIQPYEVDQAQKLIVALQCCGLQQNIHIISKGLDEERLMKIAESVGDKWKIFACTVFGPNEIHHLLQSIERDQDKALSTLRKWKRKQPAFHRDLKNKLYDELKKYNLVKAARMVFDGLDRITLYNIARQVLFDMQPLGKALGLTRYEMRESEKFNDPVQSSLAVLKLWNEKNGHDVGRIEKLCDALKHVGLEDVANWLRNLEDNEEDGCDMDCQSQKVAAEASGNPDGTPLDSKGAIGGQPAHDSEQTAENFNVNSMIEFDWGGKLYPGTVLWLGPFPDLKDLGIIAGIETEEPLEFGGNSLLFRKMKTLDCDYDKGIFIPLKRCRPDSRFLSESQMKDDFTKLTKEDDWNTQIKATEEKMRPKEYSWENERQRMEKRIKELDGEVRNLEEQLKEVNSESQGMKQRFESKVNDLERELHRTKQAKDSSQTEVERLQRELNEAREQLQIENELEKELDGEVKTLQEQLKEVNSESQGMKQRFESKVNDLERELHQTKKEKDSSQIEVEKLQRELNEAREQLQRENDLEKRTSQVDSEDASPLSTKQIKDINLADFGKFLYHLSLHLTQDVIRDLTLVLAFSPTESEQAVQDKFKFIQLMREKGLVSQADITPLTSALVTIGRHGVCDTVMKLLQKDQTEE